MRGSWKDAEENMRHRPHHARASWSLYAAERTDVDCDPSGERCNGLLRLTRAFATELARVRRERPRLSEDAAKEVVWKRLEEATGYARSKRYT